MSSFTSKLKLNHNQNKKKPPPRPPPPNLDKYRSKSQFNLNNQFDNLSLIEWSPPSSPKQDKPRNFGGSVSSSFSSSTSSLASSKRSFEYEFPGSSVWPTLNQDSNRTALHAPLNNGLHSNSNSNGTQNYSMKSNSQFNVPLVPGPTIIRPQPNKKSAKLPDEEDFGIDSSPPMPKIPPPSPPKEVADIETPYGIALYDYPATHSADLPLQVNDVVILIRRINDEWLYGKVLDKVGMFPDNFISIQVPLPDEEDIAVALYEFRPQAPEDLALQPGQKVKVLRRINNEWLYGESKGKKGQFPTNFIDRVPKNCK